MKRSLVITLVLAMLMGIASLPVAGMQIVGNPQVPGQIDDLQSLSEYQLSIAGYPGIVVEETALPRVVICQQLCDRQAYSEYQLLVSGYPNLVEATPMLAALEAAALN